MSWLLFFILLGILFLGIYFNERPEDSRVISSAPKEELGPIFPKAWIPPFEGYSWVVEEVIKNPQVIYKSTCSPELKGIFIVKDTILLKEIKIEFKDGIVKAEYL